MNNFVNRLAAAKAQVRKSPLFKRYIAGTPLESDIPVWMAEFAFQCEAKSNHDGIKADNIETVGLIMGMSNDER